MTDTREIRQAIVAGQVDLDLDLIWDTLKKRKAVLAQRRAALLQPGDEFYLVDNIKPQLLGGARCRVVKIEGSRVHVILLESRSQKWRLNNPIRVPKTLIGERAE